jgi:hypothetical protein
MAMARGGLEDIAELFSRSQYAPGETEDDKSAKSEFLNFRFAALNLLSYSVAESHRFTDIARVL